MVAHEWPSIMSTARAAPGLHEYIFKDEKSDSRGKQENSEVSRMLCRAPIVSHFMDNLL